MLSLLCYRYSFNLCCSRNDCAKLACTLYPKSMSVPFWWTIIMVYCLQIATRQNDSIVSLSILCFSILHSVRIGKCGILVLVAICTFPPPPNPFIIYEKYKRALFVKNLLQCLFFLNASPTSFIHIKFVVYLWIRASKYMKIWWKN